MTADIDHPIPGHLIALRTDVPDVKGRLTQVRVVL
jgi:hypothetical protein